jgi:hypothetical protein
VGADPVLEPVVDRAQGQVVDRDGAEVAFEVGEVLVGEHHGGGVELVGGHAGAEHVDAVQPGLGGDPGLVAGDRQRIVGDGHLEVFGHLVRVDDLADLDPDLVRAVEPAGRDGVDEGGTHLLGGVEQRGAFAGPFAGQGGVAAGDESLAGVVEVGDLGEVTHLLVEQRQLQGLVVGGELGDRRRPERGQPAQVG